MGGNALKNIETRRIDSTEYVQFLDNVRFRVERLFGKTSFHEIPYYRYKETFGDMDFVLETDDPNWVTTLLNGFGLLKDKDKWHKNGNVLSFEFDGFQIDSIHTPSKYVQSSVDYFSYNDLGNLLGRISHKLGVKLGHKGLSLIVRPSDTNTHVLSEIELSTNYRDIFDILEIDSNLFENGFDSLEEIFNFVRSSKFYNPEIFLLANRNHTSRIRDRKRNSYNKFLQYIEHDLQSDKKFFQFESIREHGGYNLREPYYSEIIVPKYPFVVDMVQKVVDDFNVNQDFKNIFNGTLMRNLTGLSGKSLGALMSRYKYSVEEKKYWVENPDSFVWQLKKDLIT